MSESRSTDPAADDLEELLGLAADDPEEFDEQVAVYVHDRAPGEEALFRSPELLQHTYDALDRLLKRTDGQLEARQRGSRKARHARRREELAREMRVVRPLLNKHLAEQNPRRRAEKILGKVFYGELRMLTLELKRGTTEAEAEAKLRASLEETMRVALDTALRAALEDEPGK